jgi:hypothetical protein
MQDIEIKQFDSSTVNYDEAPIAELSLAGISYRVDVGHGSAVAVSQRTEGAWQWSPLAEGRWDGSRLRTKGLPHEVTSALAVALSEAMRNRAEGY